MASLHLLGVLLVRLKLLQSIPESEVEAFYALRDSTDSFLRKHVDIHSRTDAPAELAVPSDPAHASAERDVAQDAEGETHSCSALTICDDDVSKTAAGLSSDGGSGVLAMSAVATDGNKSAAAAHANGATGAASRPKGHDVSNTTGASSSRGSSSLIKAQVETCSHDTVAACAPDQQPTPELSPLKRCNVGEQSTAAGNVMSAPVCECALPEAVAVLAELKEPVAAAQSHEVQRLLRDLWNLAHPAAAGPAHPVSVDVAMERYLGMAEASQTIQEPADLMECALRLAVEDRITNRKCVCCCHSHAC